MKYPLVRELAAEGFPVTVTHRVLKFSTERYYRWLKHPWSRRDYENTYLTNAAYDAHKSDPAFGYRLAAGERRVWRLCSEQPFGRASSESLGPQSALARPCTTTSSSPVLRRGGRLLVVHRRNRAPDHGGQALPLPPPRRAFGQESGLLDLGPHDRTARRLGAAQRDRPATPGGHSGAFGPRESRSDPESSSGC
jgi:hypothetical protein